MVSRFETNGSALAYSSAITRFRPTERSVHLWEPHCTAQPSQVATDAADKFSASLNIAATHNEQSHRSTVIVCLWRTSSAANYRRNDTQINDKYKKKKSVLSRACFRYKLLCKMLYWSERNNGARRKNAYQPPILPHTPFECQNRYGHIMWIGSVRYISPRLRTPTKTES